MKRKVIQIAESTQLISLPRKWAVAHNVKKGDELEVTEEEDKLTISFGGRAIPKHVTINTTELGTFNKNYLSTAYHMGYDEVEIRYDDPKTFEAIQDRVKDCIGFEIVDQGNQYCIIRSISSVSDEEFDQVLRRIFLMLQTLAKNTYEALAERNFARLEEVRALERTNNRLTDFSRRTLNKRGYPIPGKMVIIYTLIHDLERLADEYKYICDYFMSRNTRLSPEILRCFKEVNEYFDTFCLLFYKFDAAKAQRVWNGGQEIITKLYPFFGAKQVDERILAHHLINLTTKIYELTLPYYALRI